MAYNYYQPMGYTPMYQQPQMQMPQPQVQIPSSGGMLWVENQTEAAMYPVAPNAAVVLWDKGLPCVYV